MIIINQKLNQKKKITLLHAEIGWWTIGCPANGKSGFGILNDNGRNLVPAKLRIQRQCRSMRIEKMHCRFNQEPNFNTIINQPITIKRNRDKIQAIIGKNPFQETKTISKKQRDFHLCDDHPNLWWVHQPWSRQQPSPLRSPFWTAQFQKTQIQNSHKLWTYEAKFSGNTNVSPLEKEPRCIF